jgi:FdhD protein
VSSRAEFRSFTVRKISDSQSERVVDLVAAEEPLAIHVGHWMKDAHTVENLAMTMRTPGADLELALGLLVSEGIIRSTAEVDDARSLGSHVSNDVLVELSREIDFAAWRQRRSGFVSSSCGVCGKASTDQIAQELPAFEKSEWRVETEIVHGLPATLRSSQETFGRTGGVHAAALFSLSGSLQSVYEDIGRHNALDKVIGWALRERLLPLREGIVFMSSRSSFELIQKAAMAGVQMLAAVGGPSSLAIETAREFGMTLVGFVREERFNIYSGEWRVRSS